MNTKPGHRPHAPWSEPSVPGKTFKFRDLSWRVSRIRVSHRFAILDPHVWLVIVCVCAKIYESLQRTSSATPASASNLRTPNCSPGYIRSSQSSQRRSFVSGSTPTTVSRTCASSRHPGVPARICGGVWRRDCKLRVLRAFRHMKSDNQSDSDKKIEAISCAKSCPARQIGVGKNLRHVTHLVLSTVGSVCG